MLGTLYNILTNDSSVTAIELGYDLMKCSSLLRGLLSFSVISRLILASPVDFCSFYVPLVFFLISYIPTLLFIPTLQMQEKYLEQILCPNILW